MAQVVVTGASGFIGRHLVPLLLKRGHHVVEAGRRPRPGAAFVDVEFIGPDTRWTRALDGAEAVIHLAGLAHVRGAAAVDFFQVNDAGTKRLVISSLESGARLFLTLGSIAARTAECEPNRATPYGLSKLSAERHAMGFAGPGRVAIVLRPPLVYGYDAPGNWARLQKLAAAGVPLPFGAVSNRRSMCAVDNLCDAIVAAAEAGLSGRGTGLYEIADREPVSLTQVLTWLRSGMGLPSRLIPVPARLLRTAGKLAGGRRIVTALLDDLIIDPTDFMRTFSWVPPEDPREAITRSGRLYAAIRKDDCAR